MSRFFRALALAGLAGVAGCSKTTPSVKAAPSSLETALVVASPSGCRLDDDCQAGTFCFQSTCVKECAADTDCPQGSVCSVRSRCVQAGVDAGTVDQTAAASSPADLGALTLSGWPTDGVIPVPPTAPFVTLTLTASGPVPTGRLLYSVQPAGEGVKLLRAEGTSTFTLTLPTGSAGADAPTVQALDVGTPMEKRTLYLTPRHARAGLYSGTFSPPVFGGAGLPLDLVVQTDPPSALSLSDATSAWVWLSTTATSLVTLPRPQEGSSWVRRPLVFDASVGSWVAVFGETFDPSALLGPGVFPLASRSVRVELTQEDGDTLHGAIADRWKGLYDARNADGVRAPGTATVSGQFSLSRVRALPSTSTMREGTLAPPLPPQQPRPSLDACTAAMLQVPAAAGQTDGPCKDIGDLTTFASVDPSRRATCALGVATQSLSGQTVTAMLRALLDPTIPDPAGYTFASFIEACADTNQTVCQPKAAVVCARALTATAALDASLSSAQVEALSTAYDETTREAFLGRQLAALQVDTQTRLKWLQASEAPEFLASTLRDYNLAIIDGWRSKVLDAHLQGVFGQLDAAGLAVLTQSPTDPVALSNRQALLLDLSTSWRAAMDALVLLTQRWNVLLQDASGRSQAAAAVRVQATKLYVAAAILQELARESGQGALSSTFGAGFSVLQRELSRLSLPFDQLLFARDAEVVTNRSVDPSQNAASLLSAREAAARAAVADAASSVDLVLAEAQATAVSQASLTARYEDQLLTLRNELISLCGLQTGCTPGDVDGDPACAVPTGAGACGFLTSKGGLREAGSTVEAVSEAGDAISKLKEAVAARDEAQGRLDAQVQQANLLGATAIAFADKVQQWDDRRRAVATEVDALLAEIKDLNDAQVDAAVADANAQQRLREQAYARQEASLATWDQIRGDGITADMKKLQTVNALKITSSILGLSADRIDLFAKIFKDAEPAQIGTSTDPSFVARLSVRFPAAIASTVLLGAAEVFNDTASSLGVQLEGEQALREANLTRLEQLPDLDALATQNDLAGLQRVIDTKNLQSDKAVASLKALVDALQRNLDLDLAHDKDLVELRDRRDAWRLALVDLLRLQYGVTQAELTSRQRELAYYEVVQRAQLLEGRYRAMQTRFSNLESLLGAPDVVFSFSNRLARTESRIDRARTALEEWLVALEYYAVRPFVDQRLAILLARNPAQLEAIANEFLRLQRACGGPTTHETVEVSLRDDLLRAGFSTTQGDGSTASPDARLRALLAKAQTPVNRQVPYSPTQTLGQRLAAGRVWAGTFSLGIEGFANLGRTCNGKLESVAVQLVGQGFTGQPVVSLVYDGASQLRSCQPGIDTLVKSLGPGTTAFAAVTPFKTAGRTVSPVAGLTDFGPTGTANTTLEGLPLAAGYTVLIDLDHPSNKAQPWDALEDVRLQFNYSYQDVFPEGQCQ